MTEPRPVQRLRPVDPGWPARLAQHADGPTALSVRGRLPASDLPAVAIVGQRRATSYGREVAAWLADAAARAGVVVISGGAVGIDAAAHRAAADANGATVVVLGCGLEVSYPRVHARPHGLFDHVVAKGGAVVSQWQDGDEARAWRVLARNRVVAALSDAVVVVEGGARSGALNTASHAADLGVPVLAVPGDVRAPGSAAPNQLLSEGCGPCRGPDDVLAAVGARLDLLSSLAGGPGDGASTRSVLPDAVLDVLAASFPRPVLIDDLAQRSGVPAGQLLAVLTRGRIAGELASGAEGVRLRAART